MAFEIAASAQTLHKRIGSLLLLLCLAQEEAEHRLSPQVAPTALALLLAESPPVAALSSVC